MRETGLSTIVVNNIQMSVSNEVAASSLSAPLAMFQCPVAVAVCWLRTNRIKMATLLAMASGHRADKSRVGP